MILEQQNKQIDKLIVMMGTDMLNERTQQSVKTCLMGIIVEDKIDRLKSLFSVLFEKIGADKLSSDIQAQLTEKILSACQYIRDGEAINEVMKVSDFKWNTYNSPPDSINEIKKTDFKWKKGDPYPLDKDTEKVKKSNFRWAADANSIGSHVKGDS